MNVAIVNGLTGRTTIYTPAELLREARAACKGKGKLESYWVHIQDGAPIGATVSLTVQYKQPDGYSSNANVAI